MIKRLVLTVFLLFAVCSFSQTVSADDLEVELADDGHFTCTFDGIGHELIVEFPAEPEGSPLVLMLHGYGNTAESFRSTTGFHEEAVPRGFTVVYVTSSSIGWNAGMGSSSNRDTEFLVALAEYFQSEFGCDSEHTYAVGFSNGGFMAHRLAMEAGETFAAAVSVAGTAADSVWEARPKELKTGFFQITGEKDDVVPKNSDGSAKYAIVPAIEDVIAYYAEANGLALSESEEIGKGSLLEKYSDPSSDRRVWSLSVKDGRHSWPEEKITGIKTNTLILDFLAS